MTFTNKNRAARCRKALSRYKTSDTLAECLIDLLADARHWCDKNGQDFADLDRQAFQHYVAELEEERGGTS